MEELLALSGAGMLVVSRGQTAGRVPAIRLEEAPENWDDGLLPRPRFFQTAYCITTSGSSGRPKGVLVSHHSLMNYLWWAKGQYCCGGKERFALYSSFAFDFTLTSFFLPLVCGQPVRLYPGQREGNVFERMFRMGEVTVLKITPSHIPLLLDALPAPTTLHTLILGGENLSAARCAELAGAMGGSVRLFNEYGPTEATVGCMIHQYEAKDAGRDTVPLGRPIANTRVYLLDADGVPVPGGAVGELAVGGEGVALGYCDPAETARCFSSDPYAAGRMYYTGDMARIEPDGAVVMVGRRDEEVKIRGHRVCPAEIENSILRSGLVADARVAPRQIGAEKLLCAYLVGADGGTRQIREYCAAHLPSHLVPAWFCEVERIPVTRGGKLDLARLPMPNEEAPAPPDAPAPPSENLALLIGVMRTVLEGEIGPQDNFYALGGDSIKAIQISSRLRERGASLSVGDILRNPQLTRMADFMSRSDADETAKEAQGEVPVTPPIRWFLDQHLAEQGQYNQSMLLRLLRPMSAAQVGPVLEALVQHHDALRLNLDKDGRLFYNPAHRAARVPVEEMSIDRLEEIHRLETSFDLSHQLLLRARMVHCGEERHLSFDPPSPGGGRRVLAYPARRSGGSFRAAGTGGGFAPRAQKRFLPDLCPYVNRARRAALPGVRVRRISARRRACGSRDLAARCYRLASCPTGRASPGAGRPAHGAVPVPSQNRMGFPAFARAGGAWPGPCAAGEYRAHGGLVYLL